jgi:hypothetical protein
MPMVQHHDREGGLARGMGRMTQRLQQQAEQGHRGDGAEHRDQKESP